MAEGLKRITIYASERANEREALGDDKEMKDDGVKRAVGNGEEDLSYSLSCLQFA